MSQEKHDPALASDAIADAIRAKRDGLQHEDRDWAAIADELISEIDAFDLDRAEKAVAPPAAEKEKPLPPEKVFPHVVREGVRHHKPKPAAAPAIPPAPPPLAGPFRDSTLLGELRQRAWERQRELVLEQAERTAVNEAIDQGLRRVFNYLHELIKQLNIVKPQIPREFHLLDTASFANLSWQEGFVDFRTQSQSEGALVDEVSLSYQLASPEQLSIARESATSVERFRQAVFDYGLRFQCQEVRDSRRHLLRADFEIKAELSVNVRWRADYARGIVTLDTRNLERLGSYSFSVAPESLDREFLDEFGRLVLGETNRFREFCRR